MGAVQHNLLVSLSTEFGSIRGIIPFANEYEVYPFLPLPWSYLPLPLGLTVTVEKKQKSGGFKPKTTKKGLSYHEKREYEQIEDKIAEAEARVAEAQKQLGMPDVIADHTRMAKVCHELSEAQEAVSQLYERWEDLEARV